MRWVVTVICMGIIVVRAVWPELRFDNISVILLVLAAVSALLPELYKHIGKIKKVKIGDVEVELEEKLKKLAGETEAAESAVQDRKGQLVMETTQEDFVIQRLEQAGTDPRAALLLIAIEIERTVRDLAEASDIPHPRRTHPVSRLLAMLADRQVVDERLVGLFRDFWSVRNAVVHGHHFELSEGKLYELIELGMRLLRLLQVGSVRPPEQPKRRQSTFIDPWAPISPEVENVIDKLEEEIENE